MPTPITIEKIMVATAKRYGVSLADIKKEAEKEAEDVKAGKKRRRINNAAYAKQVVYYLVVRYLIYTPNLWSYLGDADHTQMSKSFKKVMDLRLVDRVTHFTILEIEEELGMMSAAGTIALMMIDYEAMINAMSDKEERTGKMERLKYLWFEHAKLVKADMRHQQKTDPLYQLSLFEPITQ